MSLPRPPQSTMIRKVPLSQTGVMYKHTGSHTTPELPLRSHSWEAQEHRQAHKWPLSSGCWFTGIGHQGVQASIHPNSQHITSQAHPAGLPTSGTLAWRPGQVAQASSRGQGSL